MTGEGAAAEIGQDQRSLHLMAEDVFLRLDESGVFQHLIVRPKQRVTRPTDRSPDFSKRCFTAAANEMRDGGQPSWLKQRLIEMRNCQLAHRHGLSWNSNSEFEEGSGRTAKESS
jgi:hypothetical protein